MDRIMAYPWPGNARELKSAFEFAFVSCPGGMIGPEHLPPQITAQPSVCIESPPGNTGQSLDEIKRQRLVDALARAGGNRTEAARLLGLSRTSVWKQIKRYNL
ncbi:helix-turn-helix domain-containing protein [Desulfosarcina cetonica]|uniref:helix-turn-helix domain-containing protein n=1 Tax=Desulfosarcina cetonica TaxID=90730 RepID=UPI00278BB9B9|nr:helix-turn-helix domain-containing protein [Desulfosarcina cetonica]